MQRDLIMNDRKKQITEEIESLRSELREIKDDDFLSVFLPSVTHMIGKCWKYKNSYSNGGEWWEYMKINGIHADDEGCFSYSYEVYSKCCRGRVSIVSESTYLASNTLRRFSEYQEIEEGEYFLATMKIAKELINRSTDTGNYQEFLNER